jgi:molybdopterin converting factor small subunit
VTLEEIKMKCFKPVKPVNIQLFADIDSIITSNTDSFGEGDDTKDTYSKLSEKLGSLGYDVILNQRDKAEFVPAHRLSEVVSQRENYRVQLETAQQQIQAMQSNKDIPQEVKDQLATMSAENQKLIDDLMKANVNMEIMSAASDAINPKDVLAFVDMDKIKIDKKGAVVGGVTEELARLRTEKPYLFSKKKEDMPGKGGTDNVGSGGNGGSVNTMNAAIRRAATGRSFSI